MSAHPLSACTIVSKNYLAYARVLARSFREHHPDGRFFVLLVDRNDSHIDPADEPFELLEVEDLTIPERAGFLFKYSIIEANTAVKPYLLAHLFATHDLPRLAYLDPDILVTRRLEPILDGLDRASIVLTPHLDTPIDDDAHPNEQAILQAGTYNLGFIALRRSDAVDRLLSWWQERLHDQCVVRVEEGLFVDQKWIDLVPGLFTNEVAILPDPGLNVAYWNLHGRELRRDGDDVSVNDQPLYFFHFSGIDPERLEPVSKHQNRFRFGDLDAATQSLYRDYAGRVLDAGHREARPWPYAFGTFADGSRIPDVARRLYLNMPPARRERFGDPFASGPGSYAAWLNESPKRSKRRPHLTRLLQHLWRQRPDLQRIFPDPAGEDLSDFSAWALDYGRHEFKLDDAFLATLARPSRADLFTLKGIRRRLINRAKRLWNGKLGLRARELAKRLLGHRRTAALRRVTKGDDDTVAVASPSVRPVTPTTIDRFGVNVIGYLRAETGMGQAARALVRALETTDVPVASYDLDLNVLARRDDTSVTGSLQAADTTADPEDDESLPYDINLLVVNADQVAAVREHLGAEAFADRWTIGYWLWELELFPERFWGAFDHLHEVWTASTFCLDAMSAVAPIPMRRMPIPVTLAAGSERFTRADFDLDDDVFVVLFLFNFLSYGARKNPLAAVQAFRQAFAGRDDVLLVLKSAHADFAPEAREALDREGADVNVRLIDRYMDRAEIDGLIRCSDVYLSLHRSEGFGLTVAEAMAAGKPVVATQYGGVTDFFNAANGYPIAYELITLEEDEGPYPAGARWADPDIDLAARRLRQIHDDRDQAQRLASHARADIDRELSYATIGRQIADHMHRVARRIEHQRLGPGLPSR